MTRKGEGPKVADRDSPAAAQRNRYFRGKLLTVADYTAEQRYHIERRRLINRAVHGWGIVAGLAVDAEDGALKISPGLAFDPQGRELVVCTDTILEREDDMVWLGRDARGLEPAAERSADSEASYLLAAHYAERGIDGVRIDDGCGDSICEANRIGETVVFSLARDPPAGEGRDASADASDGFDPCRTARLARMSGLEVDLRAPVPLARITVRFDRSGAPAFAAVDPGYQPRRLARSGPAPDPARPGEAPDEERLAALVRRADEAEAAWRAEERALHEAKGKTETARAQAGEAEARLDQARQSVQQAGVHLDTLKAEAGAVAEKLPRAAEARKQAEADLVRLRTESEAAADVQRSLAQATTARQQAEAKLPAMKADTEAASLEFNMAMSAMVVSDSRVNMSEKQARVTAAGDRLKAVVEASRLAHAELATLKADEEAMAAAARSKAAIAPDMIEAAEKRVETLRKEERELKLAAEKGATPKMIEAAGERLAVAQREEEEAGRRVLAASGESRGRSEELSAAQSRRDTAWATWQERIRELEKKRIAEAEGDGQ